MTNRNELKARLGAALRGLLPLAVQGWSFSGSQCLGMIDLSDTVDFTIR